MKKLTVKEFMALKGMRKVVLSCAFDKWTARACAMAELDMILTWANETGTLEEMLYHLQIVRKEVPNMLLGVGIPKRLAYISEEEAARCALLAQEHGADVIYSSGMSLKSFEGLARRGIPCVGHVGYLPVRNTWIGGARAVGKTVEEAKMVYNDVKAYEEAGCIGVEMELLPIQLAKAITKNTRMLTFSMGSGSDCDGQFLFSCDILGMHDEYYPRHAKRYASVFDDSIAALKRYREDVLTGEYPKACNNIEMQEDDYQEFIQSLASN